MIALTELLVKDGAGVGLVVLATRVGKTINNNTSTTVKAYILQLINN